MRRRTDKQRKAMFARLRSARNIFKKAPIDDKILPIVSNLVRKDQLAQEDIMFFTPKKEKKRANRYLKLVNAKEDLIKGLIKRGYTPKQAKVIYNASLINSFRKKTNEPLI